MEGDTAASAVHVLRRMLPTVQLRQMSILSANSRVRDGRSSLLSVFLGFRSQGPAVFRSGTPPTPTLTTSMTATLFDYVLCAFWPSTSPNSLDRLAHPAAADVSSEQHTSAGLLSWVSISRENWTPGSGEVASPGLSSSVSPKQLRRSRTYSPHSPAAVHRRRLLGPAVLSLSLYSSSPVFAACGSRERKLVHLANLSSAPRPGEPETKGTKEQAPRKTKGQALRCTAMMSARRLGFASLPGRQIVQFWKSTRVSNVSISVGRVSTVARIDDESRTGDVDDAAQLI
ncbi:hypothetical protein CPLU01_05504 [Colletotrichum plurivorum]|uniref:Uncharacterized protein n=1 Tax=Colletotrichum plurivorum TaxID=2175906 RepID=A0A8H6KLV1_9PEZI|nr:hypothetical protein CPLU01_05504 [Colletotrichum plurivorum]